jgi:hypothetical protein
MIKIKDKRKQQLIEIDLNGFQGNAFYIIALANKLSSSMGLNPKKIEQEMTSSDYDNLIKVFDSYFGHHVILYK